MPKYQRLAMQRVGRDAEELTLLNIAGEKMIQPVWETFWHVPKKLKMHLF